MKSPITTSPNRQMIECPREADVLDALASARWPDRVDAELSQHVASCEICRDVVAVSAAMQEDNDAALAEWNDANVPSSGQMWWRAEMRARQDAVREASRPVTVAQGVAVGLTLGLAGVGAWFAWPTVQAFFATLPPAAASSAAASSTAQTSGLASQTSLFASPIFLPIAVAMLALIVVTPVALYFVLSDN
jgi:hypothetical protein